jgi:Carboxypeptidase regulatory-like domain
MLRKGTLLAAVVCAVVLSIGQLSYGQATGSFSGTISDKSGSVVVGAKVTVTAQSTALTRDAQTDDTGHYLIPLLPVSNYTIHVEAPGFQPVESKDVRLQVDERREINFSLAPASVSEKVEVSGTAVAVQTSDPTLGQVITSTQVAELPLNGRNFVQLATLTPGTTQETNPDSFFNGGPSSEVSTRGSFSLSVGGSRASSTDWLLDGNDNNELTAGGIAILPSIDAIQEFKVLTYNYSAQYGTRAGPTVLVTTKSGSNNYHGSVFEFFRNTALDAKSFFATSTEKFNLNQFGGSFGGPIKKDKTFFFVDYQGRRQRIGQNFFGQVPTAAMRNGDFSEPFAGIPQLYNPYSTRSTPWPTGDFRLPFMCDSGMNPLPVNPDGTQAIGTPCNKIPQALINPIAQQMINLYPLPNVSGVLLGDFINAPSKKLDENEFDVRVDHNFSSKDSLFARFSYDQAVVFIPGGSPGFAEQNAFGSTQNIENHGRNAILSETHVLSPNTVNQFNIGYNRIFNYIQSFGSGTCAAQKLGIPGANLGGISCGLTSTQVGGGYWSLGDRGFAPFQGGTNVFTIADSFDMIRSKHDIKIGGEVRINQMNVRTNAFQDGFWIFNNSWTSSADSVAATGVGGDNMATFLLGLPFLALHDQTFKGETTGRRWKMYRPYIEDDWRVTRDLTLNLGLAWALVPPITEAQDRQANFDFKTGTFLIPGVNSDGRVGVKMDKTALEPRLGVAWKPFGSTKMVIRGGYAIFHDSSWNQGGQGLWENPPFFAESFFGSFFPNLCPTALAPSGQSSFCATAGNLGTTIPFGTGRTISDGFPILSQPTDPSTFGGNLQSQNLDFKLGRIQQYNVNIERQLPGNVVLTAGYAGSKSSHILIDGYNLNVNSPAACGTVPGYTLGCGLGPTPRYPQFGTIANANDLGKARYDSFQLKAETKSLAHGLYALIGYTYAKALDNGFSDGLGTTTGAAYFPLPGTSRADWGLSQVDLKHSLTASVTYELPFGKGKQFGSGWSGPVNAALGGWELDVIEKITSGFPLFLISSGNQSGVSFTSNANRPNQLCNGRLDNHSVSEFFNTACYQDPPTGELGNASRTPLYGPGFVNTDFSAIKHFRLTEAMNMDFRAEFFNIFNHPQFFTPGQDVDSSDFGRITRTVNNPRLIQFALKLTF